MKFTINGIEINVVIDGDVQYKTSVMEVAGEYVWSVTDLSSQRTVGGRKPTKVEAQDMIDQSVKAMQELFYASN